MTNFCLDFQNFFLDISLHFIFKIYFLRIIAVFYYLLLRHLTVFIYHYLLLSLDLNL